MDAGTKARIVEGVSRREYSMLLGAGASMGSLGGNGEPLPSGPQLRDKFVSDFSIPTEGKVIALTRAYAAARRVDPVRLEQLIRRQFTRCTPDWQHMLADFDWHRIWTLNVDDIMENVYAERKTEVDRFDWTSTFRDTSRSQQQIIHLHGFAKDVDDQDMADSNLVFSIQEYATTLRDVRAWHAVFVDEFAERPFIILGASLVEEFDLQQALASSSAEAARGFPSVIVLNHMTTLEKDEFESLGLLVVESDARAFITDLLDEVKKYRISIGDLYGRSYDSQVARFLQQFIDLRQYQPTRDDSTRNFYAGYEPHWRNILDEDDAPLTTTQVSLSAIRRARKRKESRQEVHVLTGNSGTGKSAGLLRIARELVADGLPAFLFRGDEDLNVDATMEWVRRLPETVLLFDGCADFADSIGALAEKSFLADLPLLIVGTERSIRQNFLERNIDSQHLCLYPEYEYRQLSNADIDSLINKLASRHRLGKITRWGRDRQFRYFQADASRRLFEGMANLEGGRGFRARTQRNYNRLDNASLKLLYGAASVAYQFGYALPFGTAAKVAGLPARGLQEMLIDEEQDVMVLDEHGVRPPHRMTAALVVDSALSVEEKFIALQRLVMAVAPHMDVKAIASRTRLYRLLRRLMDQESVMRLIGPEYGRKLYELMEASYGWNGRYWEQRALFESGLGNHPQARSYAEHSLRIHRHPFAFNTLGTVLGRIAVQSGDVAILREAIANLQSARDERRWEASEHPYITFFTTMIKFGQTWRVSKMPDRVRNTFAEWFNQASRSSVFSSPSSQAQLKNIQQDWLYLSVDSGVEMGR